MKVLVKRNPTMEIGDFAEKYNLTMLVKERPLHLQKDLPRYYAMFNNVEVKDEHLLCSEFGNGDTMEEAITNYTHNISGKFLVHNAFKATRSDFKAPDLYFDRSRALEEVEEV